MAYISDLMKKHNIMNLIFNNKYYNFEFAVERANIRFNLY